MVRRIVTGTRAGKSVVVSDGPVSNTHDFTSVPGFQTTLAWQLPAAPAVPDDGIDPVATVSNLLPGVGGSSLIIVQFPPDSVMERADFNAQAAGAEYAAYLPGLVDTFDPDGSGMHQTQTVDYDLILAGELWLELDDGEVRHLQAGDIVIQNGTRHAWRNRSQQVAIMAAVLLGASTR